MDLLPTLLDFIGQKPEAATVDGISIKENLVHQTELPQRDVFFAYGTKSFIRSGNWKLVCIKSENGDKIELYNLGNDIQEKNNVSSVHPDLANELLSKLELWKEEVKKGVKMVAQ